MAGCGNHFGYFDKRRCLWLWAHVVVAYRRVRARILQYPQGGGKIHKTQSACRHHPDPYYNMGYGRYPTIIICRRGYADMLRAQLFIIV